MHHHERTLDGEHLSRIWKRHKPPRLTSGLVALRLIQKNGRLVQITISSIKIVPLQPPNNFKQSREQLQMYSVVDATNRRVSFLQQYCNVDCL
jgi:hypothetical protein